MTTPYPVHIIDWSHYQEKLALKPQVLKAAGCKALVHKATEGTSMQDSQYSRRRREAAEGALPFGAYHFATASSPADAQARYFLSFAKIQTGDVRPMLDLEDGAFSTWTVKRLSDWVATWTSIVEKEVGVKPFIYTHFNLDARFKDYPLWTSRYSNSNAAPAIPSPWKSYTVHQFSNGVYGVPNSFQGFHSDLNTLADPASFTKHIIGATHTTPQEHTMHTFTEKTTYQGKTVNWGTRYIMEALNKMVRTKYFGSENEDVTMVQGSYNRGGVAASAGTHDGGGAFDLTPFNADRRVHALRLLGVFASRRLPSEGPWNEHVHCIVDGDGSASAGAKAQLVDYHAGRNGLANHAADKGYRMHVFPLFVFPETSQGKPGPMWAVKDTKSYEQPTFASKVRNEHKKGTEFTVVAVVRVPGKPGDYWAVTAAGRCLPMGVLSRKKVDGTTTPPVTPPVHTPKKVTRKVAHISLQFSDSAASHTHDIEAVFSRGYDIITGTEAGVGANNTSAELARFSREKGYYFTPVKGDTWVAVSKSIVKPGSWKHGAIFALPRSSQTTPAPKGRWGDKFVNWGQWFDTELDSTVSQCSLHYLTNGSAGPKLKESSDAAYSTKVKEWSETVAADGYALANGDFNRNDEKYDVYRGIAPFITAADELRAWQNTGHGPIDAVGRRKTDKGVRFKSWHVVDDTELSLFTDHFLTEAVVEFTV